MPETGRSLWLHPLPRAAPAKPGSCSYQRKREKPSSFLLPCKASPGTGRRLRGKELLAGEARLARLPLLPPLLKPAWASPSTSAVLLLLPLACCSDRPSHPSPGLQLHWLFPATSSSSSIQPRRASPFPCPPAAGHGESRRGCDLKLLVQLQNQDLGDMMLKLLLNSSRNLHRPPAWQREGALIAQSLGETANLPLFRLSHTICTLNPNLYKGDHRSSQTFRNMNIAESTRASPTVQDR